MRFKKYSSKWTAANLSNYLYVSSKRNKDGTYNKEDVLSVSGDLGIVNQIALLGRSYAGESVLPYHIVELNDIVYTKSPLALYPYGIIKTNRYKAGIVSTLYAVYKTKENANNRFIEHYFSLKSRINNYLKPIVRIGAKHDMKIGNNEVLENFVVFPKYDEQCDIANFLDLLNERISIQNKIIEDLQVLKKELCNKIFNSSCCDSEIKVRGIARVYGGYAFSSKTYVDNGQYKIITIGNVTGEHFISGEYNTIDCLPQNIQEQQILDNGDILISLTGNVGRISLVKGNNFLLNQRVAKLVIEDKALKDYVYQYLSHSSFEKDMQNAGQGAAQKNIKNEDILSYDIRIPSEKATLDNIVKLFLTYDIKVEHETKIIDCLQRQKAYFLNAMFI